MAFKARSLEAKHFGSEPIYDDWEGFPDELLEQKIQDSFRSVSYTHLRAHET